MKKTLLVSLCLVICLSLIASMALARTVAENKSNAVRPHQSLAKGLPTNDVSFPWDQKLNATSAITTTFLAYFTWDNAPNCVTEGWTSHDVTTQLSAEFPNGFFHVDDFAGLGGGAYGFYTPLEGSHSLWCGVEADTFLNKVTCGYLKIPGYGNNWNQSWCSKDCIDVDTLVTVTFLTTWDSEPSYDFTHLQVDNCDDNWVDAEPAFTWRYADSLYTWSIDDTLHSSGDANLRFRFHFTSDGAWSDQDGLWNTDGGVIIDSLTVVDGVGGANVLIATEDFEGEAIGATSANDWEGCTEIGYGDFSGIYQGLTTLQEDQCFNNLTCFLGFYENSPEVYDCVVPSHPEQAAVPYVNVRNQYISSEWWSDDITWSGVGSRADLAFQVYRDLPLDNLIFYVWHVRSVSAAGCPEGWQDRNFVYYGPEKDWISVIQTFGDLVSPGAVSINIALGVTDMCPVWCGVYGTGACHSHAPLIDNAEVYRFNDNGPVFSVRDINNFNDHFATDGTVSPTSTARADAAIDIKPSMNPTILYGDSVAMTCSDPQSPLKLDATISGVGQPGAAVYMYLAVWPQGQSAKEGAAVIGRDGDGPAGGQIRYRYPVLGTQTDGNGVVWTCVRFDTTFSDAENRLGSIPDGWCVDINDNLFTTGDTICFYFKAENDNSEVTYYSRAIGETHIESEVQANPMEFTILPAGGYNAGGDILYVDGMDGRGAQPFFDTAFQDMGIYEKVDRYDIRGPTSLVSNRPGGRVYNVQSQITDIYRKIIWNTGDLTIGLIGDGTGNPEKADDAFLLSSFLNNLNNTGGVYFSGDNIADELDGLAGANVAALKGFIGYTLDNGDHKDVPLGINPFGIGTDGSGADEGTCFYDGDPDTLIAYGGCPVVNNFDVISPISGTSLLEMRYSGLGNTGGAIVSQRTENSKADTVGVLLSGFSFHYIRDHDTDGILDRHTHLYRVISWLQNVVNPPTGAPSSKYAYALEQNYPNPFNPVTTIDYSLKETGNVNLRIYNVAGQLVRTLVNGNVAAGPASVKWYGRNDAGQSVSSGVYFYKLVAKDFTMTKKMVLLK
jgi:hypothetical protein